jgi:hypothetical protein
LPKRLRAPATGKESDVTLTLTARIGGDFISGMYYAKVHPDDHHIQSERLFVRVTNLLSFLPNSTPTTGRPGQLTEKGMATSHHTFTMVGDAPLVSHYYGMFAKHDVLYAP